VQPDELARLIDRADKVIVLEHPLPDAVILFDSSDSRDLEALKPALRTEPPEGFMHCMCIGSPAIALYADGQQIGQITNHHAHLIRCSLWASDTLLADVPAFLKWFDDRKIPGPRQEYEGAIRRNKERKEQERKWVEAMPSAMQPHWGEVARWPFGGDLRAAPESAGRAMSGTARPHPGTLLVVRLRGGAVVRLSGK
jgi:hypothetical protein